MQNTFKHFADSPHSYETLKENDKTASYTSFDFPPLHMGTFDYSKMVSHNMQSVMVNSWRATS